VYQYHQLRHRLKISVSSRSSTCVPRVTIERESTLLLVIIINSHYYALDFFWCRSCWYKYLHIFSQTFYRHCCSMIGVRSLYTQFLWRCHFRCDRMRNARSWRPLRLTTPHSLRFCPGHLFPMLHCHGIGRLKPLTPYLTSPIVDCRWKCSLLL
jgi:hypothetical protein